ncbi:flagellar biosynthesis repressor FlbT [Falsochrobactrum shanghaiense]|uniref:Probable flagellum biosynthesis repressor protein FlbT n=1 Tax=Falsochrobactrum shanghaiense TaxID=2201899 RepID=A0A316J960_9HYPH|nr:flagellar biosynthesis repressor FlbT [Falsochrobactrum shanghaiense]PWL17305.1 flagellar biosynthesis repressor FlbT [Falsochrobactrum shanghaiense]
MTASSKPAMRLSLRAGEKIYINGAVLKADRKVSLELLNDATFLLENHVLQPEDTTTPLRQLYFAAQMMLIEPAMHEQARSTFMKMLKGMITAFSDAEILNALKIIDELVHCGRVFEALKMIRALYPREAELMGERGMAVPSAKTQNATEASL